MMWLAQRLGTGWGEEGGGLGERKKEKRMSWERRGKASAEKTVAEGKQPDLGQSLCHCVSVTGGTARAWRGGGEAGGWELGGCGAGGKRKKKKGPGAKSLSCVPHGNQ